MAKRKRKADKQKPPWGTVAFILAIILPIIAAFLFVDYLGVPYGAAIWAIWTFAALVSFGLGLIFFGQFVLPYQKDYSWLNGIRMLWRNVVRSVPTSSTSAKKRQEPRPEGRPIPTSFKLVKAGNLRSNEVAVVVKGGQFVRTDGPGFVRLDGSQAVGQILDLRTHFRKQDVTVNTRDGIRLETSVNVVFRIKQDNLTPEARVIYPYDREAVFAAAQSNTVDSQNEISLWSEQLAPQAAAILVSELAKHRLDELTQDPSILGSIRAEIAHTLNGLFDGEGVEVLSAGVGPLGLPEDVNQQRLDNWRAPWQREILLQQATGDAEGTRRLKRARARAQVEIIQTITQNIEEMRRADPDNLSNIVNLRMIEVLEDAISQNNLRNIIPEQLIANLVLEASGEMRNLLGSGQPGEEDETR